MRNLFFLLWITLLLPVAVLAAGDAKQLDKLDKGTDTKLAQQNDKQDKAVAAALDPVRFAFVRQNLISTFYHEMAHALIDVMNLPVLGQEEDAADVFSMLMVQRLFPKGQAMAINKGAANGFSISAIKRRATGHEWDWADEHGPDMQRYYNLVCLIFGADTKQRADFASEMALPEHRAKKCAAEFAQAERSWGPIIGRIYQAKTNAPVRFRHSARTPLQIQAAEIIAAEVRHFNGKYSLADGLRVVVKRCVRGGNTYAFYSPSRKKITLCTNYIDKLYRNAPKS